MAKEGRDEMGDKKTRYNDVDDDDKTGINDLVDEGGGTDRTPTGIDDNTDTKERLLPTLVDKGAITREQLAKTGIFEPVDPNAPTQVRPQYRKPTVYAEPLGARKVPKTIHDDTTSGVAKTLADTLNDEPEEDVDDKLKTKLSRTKVDATINEEDQQIKTAVDILFPTVMEIQNKHIKAAFWRWFTEIYSPNPHNREAGKQLVNYLANIPQDEPDKKAIRKLLTNAINWSQTIN